MNRAGEREHSASEDMMRELGAHLSGSVDDFAEVFGPVVLYGLFDRVLECRLIVRVEFMSDETLNEGRLSCERLTDEWTRSEIIIVGLAGWVLTDGWCPKNRNLAFLKRVVRHVS